MLGDGADANVSRVEFPGTMWHFHRKPEELAERARSMNSTLAAKLRMTAAVLGCTSRKDLCARFRAVNPDTSFDLERSHKWMQGRALPRDARVYADWARVLGSDRPGSWFASCDLDSFAAELRALFGVDPARLEAASLHASHPATGRPYLSGSFACYSPAWSPYHRGKLIRGALRLAPGRGDALGATYTERLDTGEIRFRGDAIAVERTLHLTLREEATRLPLFASLLLPGPPGSVLCGVLSGAAFLGQDQCPTSSRFLAVRVADGAALDASNRYMDAAPGAVGADLAALGVPVLDHATLDVAAQEFFRPGTDNIEQVPSAIQARLADLLDRAWLNARSGAPVP